MFQRLWLAVALLAPLAAADPASTARRAFLEQFNGSNPIRRRYECATLKGIRVDGVTVDGDRAKVALTVDAVAELPLSRARREYPPHWTVELQRRGSEWRARDVAVPEAALAHELSELSDPSARWRALNAHSELMDAELVHQLCDIAFAIIWKSEYRRGLEEGELALSIAREAAPSEEARAWWIIGRAHNLMRDVEGEKEAIAQGLALAREWNDREIEARVLVLAGWSYALPRRPVESIAAFEQGLQIAEALGNDHIAEEADLGLGFVKFTVQDDYVRSIPYDESARARAARTGDRVIEAAALANLGVVYDRIGNGTRAIPYMRRAVELYRAAGNTRGVLRNLRNLAEIEALWRRYDDAENDLRQLDKLLQTSSDARTSAFIELTRANIAVARKQTAEADVRIAAALEKTKPLHDEMMITFIDSTQMAIRFEQHRYDDALALADEIVKRTLTVTPNFDAYWQTKLTAGHALEELGRLDEARAAFQDAVDSIESRRSGVPGSGEDEQHFFNDKTTPYLALFDLAVRRHDDADAVRWMERARSRTLIESLAVGRMKSARSLTAEELEEERRADAKLKTANIALRDAQSDDNPDAARVATLTRNVDAARLARDELTSQLYIRHPELSLARATIPLPDLDEIRRRIPADGVVLEYLVDIDFSWLVTITRDDAPRFHRIPIGRVGLAKRVARFQQRIARRYFGYRPEAQRLYGLLLAPADDVLRTKKIVCIIPHDSLWTLPFQVLIDRRGRSLIQRHPLFYAPSLTILSWYASHPRKTSGERSLLAAGDPRGAALPDAEREVRGIARFFDPRRTLVLTGREATETRVKREAAHYSVLHFATHGTFENELAMYSHIVLARKAGDPDDGQLEAREIADLHLDADLVVLSSCDTARGSVRVGEGMVGMSWALLAAGCPRAVVTQWEIGSSSSGQLMIDFNRRLAAAHASGGRATTEALRQAQLKAIADKDHAHPYYWAGFIEIGYGW
jgi:CHAT domain-containing protein/predicted negative regulator of RcsB-dependent stress response